jgi:hypothetical protein
LNTLPAVSAIAQKQTTVATVASNAAIAAVSDPARAASRSTGGAIAAIAIDQSTVTSIAGSIAGIGAIAK